MYKIKYKIYYNESELTITDEVIVYIKNSINHNIIIKKIHNSNFIENKIKNIQNKS